MNRELSYHKKRPHNIIQTSSSATMTNITTPKRKEHNIDPTLNDITHDTSEHVTNTNNNIIQTSSPSIMPTSTSSPSSSSSSSSSPLASPSPLSFRPHSVSLSSPSSVCSSLSHSLSLFKTTDDNPLLMQPHISYNKYGYCLLRDFISNSTSLCLVDLAKLVIHRQSHRQSHDDFTGLHGGGESLNLLPFLYSNNKEDQKMKSLVNIINHELCHELNELIPTTKSDTTLSCGMMIYEPGCYEQVPHIDTILSDGHMITLSATAIPTTSTFYPKLPYPQLPSLEMINDELIFNKDEHKEHYHVWNKKNFINTSIKLRDAILQRSNIIHFGPGNSRTTHVQASLGELAVSDKFKYDDQSYYRLIYYITLHPNTEYNRKNIHTSLFLIDWIRFTYGLKSKQLREMLTLYQDSGPLTQIQDDETYHEYNKILEQIKNKKQKS